jgi:hypothetical protein
MKSGIELIQELLEEVRTLNKRFEITEQNVKLLLQKVNVNVAPQQTIAQPTILANDSPVKIKSVEPEPEPAISELQKNANGSTRVIGKVQDGESRIISGLPVKIYNIGNQLVKDTKTNRAGEWMCFLTRGVYYAKYQLDGQMPTQVNFKVGDGQTIVRVANN